MKKPLEVGFQEGTFNLFGGWSKLIYSKFIFGSLSILFFRSTIICIKIFHKTFFSWLNPILDLEKII